MTDVMRNKRNRLQLAGLVAIIVVFGVRQVVRSRDESAGTVVLEIGAALVVVAITLLVFRRFLGTNSDSLQDIRRTTPVAYLCYLENGKRGVVSVDHGDLVVRRFKGKQLVDLARLPAGTYGISPATVQLTPARRAEGIAISDAGAGPSGGELRIALSQDTMTLVGSTLKGADLAAAAAALQNGVRTA